VFTCLLITDVYYSGWFNRRAREKTDSSYNGNRFVLERRLHKVCAAYQVSAGEEFKGLV